MEDQGQMYPTESRILHAIEQAKREFQPSRELSLVLTKLEEALLWLSKVTASKNPSSGIGE